MHEIVIARRNDLQERKRLLIVGTDALAVLLGSRYLGLGR